MLKGASAWCCGCHVAACFTIYSQVAEGGACSSLYLDIGALKQEENRIERVFIDGSNICHQFSMLYFVADIIECCAPLSVISAKVKLALRCRSMLCEYTRVLRALRGSPVKKSVSCRCRRASVKMFRQSTRVYTDIFEEIQQICNSFPLAVGENIVIIYLAPTYCKSSVISIGSQCGNASYLLLT